MSFYGSFRCAAATLSGCRPCLRRRAAETRPPRALKQLSASSKPRVRRRIAKSTANSLKKDTTARGVGNTSHVGSQTVRRTSSQSGCAVAQKTEKCLCIIDVLICTNARVFVKWLWRCCEIRGERLLYETGAGAVATLKTSVMKLLRVWKPGGKRGAFFCFQSHTEGHSRAQEMI